MKTESIEKTPHGRDWLTVFIALLLHIFLLSGYLYVGRPWRFFLFFAIVSLYWLAVLSLFVPTLWLEPILSVFAYLVAVGGVSLVLNLFLLLYVATSIDVVRLALQKPLPAKYYSNGSLYLLLILPIFIGLPIIVSADQLGSIERHFFTQRKSFDKIQTMLVADGKIRMGCLAIARDDARWACYSRDRKRCVVRHNHLAHGISRRRFNQYVKLLNETKASSGRYCYEDVSIAYRSFGCRTEIVLKRDGSVPRPVPEVGLKVIPLAEGWHLRRYCR